MLLCPVNSSQTPRKKDLHKHLKTLSANMPRTKVDDTERKRQGRAASPSERGRRSERAPWFRARDANRKRQERTPSRTSSADAAGQALSKKARALARIRPFVHSFAASITAPAPAQQLKCQPLAFDDSSRDGLWPRSRERLFHAPPPSVGVLDLDSRSSGCARLGLFRGPQHGLT